MSNQHDEEMKRDIKAIILMLATQGMINLGQIPDPMTGQDTVNPEGAKLFIDLLEVLEEKTRGNLSQEEDTFFKEIMANLKLVYVKKTAPTGS